MAQVIQVYNIIVFRDIMINKDNTYPIGKEVDSLVLKFSFDKQ